jgi:hypothetical protein
MPDQGGAPFPAGSPGLALAAPDAAAMPRNNPDPDTAHPGDAALPPNNPEAATAHPGDAGLPRDNPDPDTAPANDGVLPDENADPTTSPPDVAVSPSAESGLATSALHDPATAVPHAVDKPASPSGDEPSGEERSGDEPSGDEASGDEASGDEASAESLRLGVWRPGDPQLTVPYVPSAAGLDETLPGPELSTLLSTIDRRTLNGYQLLELVQARYRQVCFDQAQLLADIHEIYYSLRGHSRAAPRRANQHDHHVEEEMSMALRWTMYTANKYASVAWACIDMQPVLLTALAEGRIDLAKAEMIVTEVSILDQNQTSAVVAAILPLAPNLTCPELRHEIRKLIMTIDPELVQKRHDKDLENRDVSAIQHRNGTCSIQANYLPPDKAAQAMDYLNAVATATKKAGDPNGRRFDDRDKRTTAQIRADVFLDLLAGVDPTIPAADGGAGALNPGPRRGGVNLTVELDTLLCLNDHAAELDGFGHIPAGIARQIADRIAADQLGTHPVWRFTVTDHGKVIHEGRLHYRPNAEQKSFVQARDRYCRFPGCRRPAKQCDIDHINPWENNGITHEDNMCVLCRRHHRAKHNGFTLYRTEFGLLWISPRGKAYPVSFGHELDTHQRKLLQHLINNGELPDGINPQPVTSSRQRR